jgi:hypothetical protein
MERSVRNTKTHEVGDFLFEMQSNGVVREVFCFHGNFVES